MAVKKLVWESQRGAIGQSAQVKGFFEGRGKHALIACHPGGKTLVQASPAQGCMAPAGRTAVGSRY